MQIFKVEFVKNHINLISLNNEMQNIDKYPNNGNILNIDINFISSMLEDNQVISFWSIIINIIIILSFVLISVTISVNPRANNIAKKIVENIFLRNYSVFIAFLVFSIASYEMVDYIAENGILDFIANLIVHIIFITIFWVTTDYISDGFKYSNNRIIAILQKSIKISIYIIISTYLIWNCLIIFN